MNLLRLPFLLVAGVAVLCAMLAIVDDTSFRDGNRPISHAGLVPALRLAANSDASLRTYEITIATSASPIRWNAQQGKHFGTPISLPEGTRVAAWPGSVDIHQTTNQAIRIRSGAVFFVISGTDHPSSGTPMIAETAMPITMID